MDYISLVVELICGLLSNITGDDYLIDQLLILLSNRYNKFQWSWIDSIDQHLSCSGGLLMSSVDAIDVHCSCLLCVSTFITLVEDLCLYMKCTYDHVIPYVLLTWVYSEIILSNYTNMCLCVSLKTWYPKRTGFPLTYSCTTSCFCWMVQRRSWPAPEREKEKSHSETEPTRGAFCSLSTSECGSRGTMYTCLHLTLVYVYAIICVRIYTYLSYIYIYICFTCVLYWNISI